MANKSKISKMFGALVLGGCFHQSNPANSGEPEADTTEAKPAIQDPTQPTSENPSRPNQDKSPEEAAPADYCQLEFNLNKYARFNEPGAEEGKVDERVRTCLDDKPDEEILKIIKEAKTQTCNSPFCGCWLG
jgi:hypothetical protein